MILNFSNLSFYCFIRQYLFKPFSEIKKNKLKVVGNKMSVTNLATIFGPNLLHNHKNVANNNGVADITIRKVSNICFYLNLLRIKLFIFVILKSK